MNLDHLLRPKLFFRKGPKPTEHLDAGGDRRSESSFSFIIAPATPPQSPSPVSDEADSAYRDALMLLSRYRDVFYDNIAFQQLEERARKLSSPPTSPIKLIKGPKKSLFKGPKNNNEKQERQRTDTTLLLHDIQTVIGNLTGHLGSISTHHLIAPASVRSSSDPLPLGRIDSQHKGLERRKSVRRRRSGEKLPAVHEKNHDISSKVHDDGHGRRGERYDRAPKPTEREIHRDRHHDKHREREVRHRDEYWDHDYKHRRKHRHEAHGSLDENGAKYYEKGWDNYRHSHRRRKHGDGASNLLDEGPHKDEGIHHNGERGVEKEIYYNKEREKAKKERERMRPRDRDRDRDGDRRERNREREREWERERETHKTDKESLGHDEGKAKADEKNKSKRQRQEVEPTEEGKGTEEYDRDKGGEKEPNTPKQESAAAPDHQQEGRKRERREKRDRDDPRRHHDYYDRHHDDRYGWTRRSLVNKKQGHKRSHSHSGYARDQYQQEEHEKHTEKHYHHDDIEYQGPEDSQGHLHDTIRRSNHMEKESERMQRMHPPPKDREYQPKPKQHGSDEESIRMVPPPGWRAEQHHAANDRRTQPHRPSSPSALLASPAPPTVMDYPSSMHRGLTLDGKMKSIVEVQSSTHRGLGALQTHQQILGRKTKQPQHIEVPIVWNKASLGVPGRSERTQQRSPWLTSTGSRLRENFTPNGQRMPLPLVSGQ